MSRSYLDGARVGFMPHNQHANLPINIPKPFVTSEMIAAAEEERELGRNARYERMTPETEAIERRANEIWARHQADWLASHPSQTEADWLHDPNAQLAVGREAWEAKCTGMLGNQLLCVFIERYRRSINDPTRVLNILEVLATHETIMVRDKPWDDLHLKCVRCGATHRKLTDAVCRWKEIERERRLVEREKLGSLVSAYSNLGA